MRLTDAATAAVGRATGCARRLGHSFVGSEHLLYGLASDDRGLVSAMLSSYGVTAAAVEAAVASRYGRGAPNGAPPGLTPRGKRVLEGAAAGAAAFGQSHV
ncbi:MAG TPA: Clp protease N-terminal domain-containing protein, partial [Candidatus Acidoferrum sp.]|nr:Clp protease N-terminal domain-containing protein [Candidatus Acidoferrum sp.]